MKLLNSNNLCEFSITCGVPNKNGDAFDGEALKNAYENFLGVKLIKAEIDGDYLNMVVEVEAPLNYVHVDITL